MKSVAKKAKPKPTPKTKPKPRPNLPLSGGLPGTETTRD